MIIFDENIESYWIEKFKVFNSPYISIRESHSGISDSMVIDIVKKYNGLLVTEDKDF